MAFYVLDGARDAISGREVLRSDLVGSALRVELPSTAIRSLLLCDLPRALVRLSSSAAAIGTFWRGGAALEAAATSSGPHRGSVHPMDRRWDESVTVFPAGRGPLGGLGARGERALAAVFEASACVPGWATGRTSPLCLST